MAEAIVGGILDTHSLEPQSICISDPDPKRRCGGAHVQQGVPVYMAMACDWEESAAQCSDC